MKIRVGVFFGGRSVEHEVSVISAMQALAALDREKYEAVPVYVSKAGGFYTGPQAASIEGYRDIPALLRELVAVDVQREGRDVCLLRHKRRPFGSNTVATLDVALPVFHGTAGEDGAFQGLMAHVGLPYAGCDVGGSSAGMDKWVMKALFAAAGIPHLPAVRAGRTAWYSDAEGLAARIEREVGYPCMVKPLSLGSSVGIGRADSRAELDAALDTAFEYAHVALAERAVTPLREINCAVLGDMSGARASVCEEPVLAGAVLTFQDKYQRGGKAAKSAPKTGGEGMASLSRRIPADLPPETASRIQALAVEAFHAIGAAGVSRVDFLMQADTGELWVNEINTIPGSLAFYLWEAAGLPFPALLDALIALALKRERDNARIQFSFETNLLQTVSLGGGSKGKV